MTCRCVNSQERQCNHFVLVSRIYFSDNVMLSRNMEHDSAIGGVINLFAIVPFSEFEHLVVFVI